MKKMLYMLLAVAIFCMTACDKSDEIPGGGEPTVEKEWIIFDDVVMASESQVFDTYFETTGNTHPAVVKFHAQLFKGTRYLLNSFQKIRVIAVAGGASEEWEAPAWGEGEGAMRYCRIAIEPQESGPFDFYIEVLQSDIILSDPRPYAFRSKVYRLVLSKIEGGWNIDSFGLAPGQAADAQQ